MNFSVIKRFALFAPQLFRFFSRGNIPFLSKLLVIIAALYIIFPFDFIPDFFPVFGWLEDIVIGLLAFRFVNSKTSTDNSENRKNETPPITVKAKVIEEE